MPAGTRPDVTCESAGPRGVLKIRYARAEIVFSVNQLTRSPDDRGRKRRATVTAAHATRMEMPGDDHRPCRSEKTDVVRPRTPFWVNVYLHTDAADSSDVYIHRERRGFACRLYGAHSVGVADSRSCIIIYYILSVDEDDDCPWWRGALAARGAIQRIRKRLNPPPPPRSNIMLYSARADPARRCP